MLLKRAPALAALTVTALLLASCDPNRNGTQPPAVTDPAATAPATPVAGQSTEAAALPQAAASASLVVETMLDPKSTDFDPDLRALLNLFPSPSMQSLTQPAQTVGRSLLGAFGLPTPGKLQVQTTTPVTNSPLATGTITFSANGQLTTSPEPRTGLIIRNLKTDVTLQIDWKVNGAQTVWLEQKTHYGTYHTELPTRATATMNHGGKVVAQVTHAMTPGGCLSSGGPDALTLTGWAGRENTPPAKANLSYSWTESGVQLKGAVAYHTKSRVANAAFDVNVTGTTAGRCTPQAFSFTPTRADVSAQVNVPGHNAQATLYLRDLKNMVISDSALKAEQPFKAVSGRINASLSHQGTVALTAFGELASSNVNPLPGDQVKVQYIKGGALVTTTLEALIAP